MVVTCLALRQCLQHARRAPPTLLYPIRSLTKTSRFLSSQNGDDQNQNKDKENVSSKSKDGKKDEAADGSTTKSSKAKTKLNNLLQSIVKDQEIRDAESAAGKSKPKIDLRLAKPIREPLPKPTLHEVNAEIEKKQTEKEIGKEMFSAVKSITKNVVESDAKEIETELVKKLKSHSPNKIDFNELFTGMKVDSTKQDQPQRASSQTESQDLSRAHRVRRILGEQRDGRGPRDGRNQYDSRRQPDRQDGKSRESYDGYTFRPIDLFGSPPLGIFSKAKLDKKSDERKLPQLKTWDALYAKDLKLAVTHPPANGFEEMILWTEQGKLWKFPINNEQGLDIEAKVQFTEHIFLEPMMEHWCPKRGPIRHFMELVCIALSKNPYLTVQEKKDHLDWYHQYFIGKSSVIKEIGGLEGVIQ